MNWTVDNDCLRQLFNYLLDRRYNNAEFESHNPWMMTQRWELRDARGELRENPRAQLIKRTYQCLSVNSPLGVITQRKFSRHARKSCWKAGIARARRFNLRRGGLLVPFFRNLIYGTSEIKGSLTTFEPQSEIDRPGCELHTVSWNISDSRFPVSGAF